jgi:hypothetical protein
MEETLEGGQGPPRAVAPLEREKEITRTVITAGEFVAERNQVRKQNTGDHKRKYVGEMETVLTR